MKKILLQLINIFRRIKLNLLQKLDEAQEKAKLTEEKNVLIVAAPGSGKTTTIINRVAFLCDSGISRDNIIIITFTKAAANNMKNRYKNLTSSNNVPFFGTFHSLFYKILKRVGYNFHIIPNFETINVIKEVLNKFYDEVSEDRIKEILNYISIFKTSNLNLFEFEIEEYPMEIFREAYEAYEAYKINKSYYDFDDLQIKAFNLFSKDHNLLKSYSKLFRYILIDEFQDCDMLQIEILKLFETMGSSIFAVGDEDQCIYGFRGSRPDCMVDFSKHFNGGKKLYLCNNYRSPKNIVQTSKCVIKNNIMRNNKNIIAKNEKNGEIKIELFNDEGDEGETIGDNILKIVNGDKYKFKDNAILYRTNLESRSIIDAFIKRGIPFNLIDRDYNFYEHFICRDILSYLRLSLNPNDRESFIRVINKPFRYISKDNIYALKNHMERDNCFDILASYSDIKEFQIKKIMELKKDISFLNRVSLGSAIDFVLYDLNYYKHIEEYSKRYKTKLSELEEIINEFRESASDFKNILSFLSHVEKVKEELENSKKQNSNKDGVLLSTIHGVKGMEFKNVFLINANEGIIPHANSMDSKEHIEEERRLFYVGITRAMENLWVGVLKTLRGTAIKPSRFLEEMNLDEDKLPINFKKGNKVIHKFFGEGVIVHLETNTIEILFNDGVERKLDFTVSYYQGLLKKIT